MLKVSIWPSGCAGEKAVWEGRGIRDRRGAVQRNIAHSGSFLSGRGRDGGWDGGQACDPSCMPGGGPQRQRLSGCPLRPPTPALGRCCPRPALPPTGWGHWGGGGERGTATEYQLGVMRLFPSRLPVLTPLRVAPDVMTTPYTQRMQQTHDHTHGNPHPDSAGFR
jgi:hypothetical protein